MQDSKGEVTHAPEKSPDVTLALLEVLAQAELQGC